MRKKKIRKGIWAVICMMLICILTMGNGKIPVLAAEYPLSVSLSPTGNDYEYRMNLTNISSESVVVDVMQVSLYQNYDGDEDYWGRYGDVCDDQGNVVVGSPDGFVNQMVVIDVGQTISFIVEPGLGYGDFITAYEREGAFISVMIRGKVGQNDSEILAEYRYVISQEVQEPEIQDPEIIEGDNGSWEQGSEDGLTFRSSAEFDEFQKVLVDGNEISENDYTVKAGSTIVTLKANYLATLAAGNHTISIVSTGGNANGTFTIAMKTQNVQNPGGITDTGEDAQSTKNNSDEKQESKNETNEETIESEDKQAEQQLSSNVVKSPQTGDQESVSAFVTITLAAAMVICFTCRKIYRKNKI